MKYLIVTEGEFITLNDLFNEFLGFPNTHAQTYAVKIEANDGRIIFPVENHLVHLLTFDQQKRILNEFPSDWVPKSSL